MTICLLFLVSISAIPCDVKQQNANSSLSDITEERKVGQEVDEEEEVVGVDLGRGGHIPQYVQILDFLEGEKKYNDSFSSRLYRDGPYMPPPPTDVADPASLQELQVIWEVTFTRLTSQNKVPSIFKSPWRSE